MAGDRCAGLGEEKTVWNAEGSGVRRDSVSLLTAVQSSNLLYTKYHYDDDIQEVDRP